MLVRKVTLGLMLVALVLATGCQSVAPNRPGPTSPLEVQMLSEMNRVRATEGLQALRLIDALSGLARAHSEQMASGQAGFSHGGFNARAEAAMQATGANSVGENLARSTQAGPALAAETIQSWLNDRPHRKNLLGDFQSAGLGIWQSPSGEFFITLLLTQN